MSTLTDFNINTNTKAIGQIVKQRIFKQLMLDGDFLIPELAEKVGFSITTVKKYVQEMIANGIVVELGKQNTQRAGRQAIKYSIKEDSCYFLGVDIKNTDLIICLSKLKGDIVKIQHYPEFVFTNTHNTLDQICNTILSFIDDLDNIDKSKILDINVNISGRVNSKLGTSASVFAFEDMQNINLADLFTERLGRLTFIENDTKSMTYGEYIAGGFSQFKNLLFVNISWGIGLGIVIDGKIYSGKDGYSGEMGHMNLYDNNIMCHCGKKGCLETEISGSAIHRKLIQRISAGETSILSHKVLNAENVRLEDIIAAVDNEDPLCIDLIENSAVELGRQLASLINLFNPEAIIIGGTLAQIHKDYFIRPIDLAIKRYSLRLMSQNVPILTSKLLADAGAIGASLIARKRIFEG